MAKFTAISADWEKKIGLDNFGSYEETIFEVATRAVEWALRKDKDIGLFVEIEDENIDDRNFCVLTYKVLSNAGYHGLAEKQREAVQEEYQIDLAENIELGKLINKLNKAACKKAYCIAEMVSIPGKKSSRKTAVVCMRLGLFESAEDARAKCKELNLCVKSKKFIVKEISFNN